MFDDFASWAVGTVVMLGTVCVWIGWRSGMATVKRARRVIIAVVAALGAAAISLAASGQASTMGPTAVGCVVILMIEGLAAMVGANAKADPIDDSPSARAIRRDN